MAGLLFLLSVMATQPPWTLEGGLGPLQYFQFVELAGLVVLAAVPTGRLAGLDFFVRRAFGRNGCCGKQKTGDKG